MHTPRPLPTSTYRLQLHAGFTFDDARAQLDYLAELGISHVFCAPILQAAPGSTHGYDVVDHSRVSEDLGGEEAFRRFAAAAHERGLGVIVDVVPNHMAIPSPLWLNRAFWDVLQHGAESAYARWFDIDLASEKTIVMPVLGQKIGDELQAGSIQLSTREIGDGPAQRVLTYYGHVFPLRPGTEDLPLLELLEQQWYRLAHWKVASEELNYRRFFDVDTLAAVRVEDPDVFATTHRKLAELFHDGLIDGFRIDHIDGLANPRDYFEQLQQLTGGCWVVAEKILEFEEQLPREFPLAGTTGYDALLRAGGLFHDPAHLPRLDEMWERVGGIGGFSPILAEAKEEVIRGMLFTEVNRLTSLAMDICGTDIRLGDHTRRHILRAIRALLRAMDRYRIYVEPGLAVTDHQAATLQAAVERARSYLEPDAYDTLDLVASLVRGDLGATGADQGAASLPSAQQATDQPAASGQATYSQAQRWRAEFMVRFAQTCGPVMAKSKEDTAFYRHSRFLAVNDVGLEPTVVGISTDMFHDFCEASNAAWPSGMTTLSTHDTKRSEDVRARLACVLEHAQLWEQTVQRVRAATSEVRSDLVDGATELFVWQTLAGTWALPGTLAGVAPISEARLAAYLTKGMREAKRFTSWTAPDETYEEAVQELARGALRSPDVRAAYDEFVETTIESARAFILGQKLVQLTMPGVPDVYQGCEMVDLSLVDPDNRRPVDYAARRLQLRNLQADSRSLDAEKLLVVHRALQVRRAHPEAFRGESASYMPVPSTSGQAVAFARGVGGDTVAITVATRQPATLQERGGWLEHKLILPDGEYVDVLTGTQFTGGETLLADVLAQRPVALLVSQETGEQQA